MRGLPVREKVNWRIDRQGLAATFEPAVPGLEHFVLPLEPMIGCFGWRRPWGRPSLPRPAPRTAAIWTTEGSLRRHSLVSCRGAGRAVLFLATATRRTATARSLVPASRPALRWRCA